MTKALIGVVIKDFFLKGANSGAAVHSTIDDSHVNYEKNVMSANNNMNSIEFLILDLIRIHIQSWKQLTYLRA